MRKYLKDTLPYYLGVFIVGVLANNITEAILCGGLLLGIMYSFEWQKEKNDEC